MASNRRGGRYGPWPGRGPFSYLPPWQRPGWQYGRGACWRLLPSMIIPPSSTQLKVPIAPKEQEIAILKNQTKWLEQTLEQIKTRLEELKKEE